MILLDQAPTQEEITNDIWKRWFNRLVVAFNNLTATGTTAQRPNPAPFVGFMYFDTTLSRPIWAKTSSQSVFSDGTNA